MGTTDIYWAGARDVLSPLTTHRAYTDQRAATCGWTAKGHDWKCHHDYMMVLLAREGDKTRRAVTSDPSS